MCILRYMPEQRSVRVDDDRGVVIKPGGALLEQRRDDHHIQLPRAGDKRFGRRSRESVRPDRTGAASSSRQKYCDRNSSCRQTICAPCPAASRMLPLRLFEICAWIARTGHLDQSHAKLRDRSQDYCMIVRFRMTCRALSFRVAPRFLKHADVPTPKEFLGFRPGDDYKLANYEQISGLFSETGRRQATASGSSSSARRSFGKPMYVAFISAPENLAKLDHYRDISRRLALGRAERVEARALSRRGKSICVDRFRAARKRKSLPRSIRRNLRSGWLTGEDEETRAHSAQMSS